MFSRILTQKSILTYSEQIGKVRQALHEADAVVIGAGAGLSTSAGLTYSGPRFQEHFGDFIQKYKIQDMYSGGFYPFGRTLGMVEPPDHDKPIRESPQARL